MENPFSHIGRIHKHICNFLGILLSFHALCSPQCLTLAYEFSLAKGR